MYSTELGVGVSSSDQSHEHLSGGIPMRALLILILALSADLSLASIAQAGQTLHRRMCTHTHVAAPKAPTRGHTLVACHSCSFQKTIMLCTQCPKAVGPWVGEAPATVLQHAKLVLGVVARHVATAAAAAIVSAMHDCPKAVSPWAGGGAAATH